MADKQLVEMIKSGVGADFRGTSLQGADLRGAFLKGASLYNANLQGADLVDANLMGADLSGAKLYNADFRGANLQDANLKGANLYNATLQDADLYDANLQGADLFEANFRNANLRGADLRGAFLVGAKLTGADLRGILYDSKTKWPKGFTPPGEGSGRMASRRLSRFEEGVPADPTENMSPEDAAEWEEMNEKYGDKFKKASGGTRYAAGKIVAREPYMRALQRMQDAFDRSGGDPVKLYDAIDRRVRATRELGKLQGIYDAIVFDVMRGTFGPVPRFLDMRYKALLEQLQKALYMSRSAKEYGDKLKTAALFRLSDGEIVDFRDLVQRSEYKYLHPNYKHTAIEYVIVVSEDDNEVQKTFTVSEAQWLSARLPDRTKPHNHKARIAWKATQILKGLSIRDSIEVNTMAKSKNWGVSDPNFLEYLSKNYGRFKNKSIKFDSDFVLRYL
jgi:uncharacterized protein YjbI with pentapeptide repeats